MKIDLAKTSLFYLQNTGIQFDHPIIELGKSIQLELEQSEIEKLENLGIEFQTTIEDMESFYVRQIASNSSQNDSRADDYIYSNLPHYKTPKGFHLGNMGGYFTYEDMLAQLDSMHLLFPELISARDSFTEATFEGRSIYWLKTNAADSSAPKILYNALHHAREGASLTSLMFYMWYLLENYDTNPEIKYLLDNTQMYFVPCLNPDGYIYNQTTHPNGGGMWRKNRRFLADASYGVDLNRNYGYNWGYNSAGSSGNFSSNTYRGDSAFSEPETRGMKAFCEAEQFEIVLNYHSYGNLLIYPWGYEKSLFTPDSALFLEMSRVMTAHNAFIYGTGDQTVGYVTNGDSDDWMYGEQTTKPKILSWTPELGSAKYGFWPPSDQIIPIAQSSVNQNLKAAHMILGFPELQVEEKENAIAFHIQFLGTKDSIPTTVTFHSISDHLAFSEEAFVKNHYKVLDTWQDEISFELFSNDTCQYVVHISTPKYTYSDTFEFYPLNWKTVMDEDGSSMENWTSELGLWGINDSGFHSNADASKYEAASNTRLVYNLPIDLSKAVASRLELEMFWDIEDNFDYVQIQASHNNFSWEPLNGKFSRLGTEDQDELEPLYHGLSKRRVKESFDLSSYHGGQIYLRFYLRSDSRTEGSGVSISNVKVKIIEDSLLNTSQTQTLPFISKAFPNPSNSFVFIQCNLEQETSNTLFISNLAGQIIRKELLNHNEQVIKIELDAFTKGVYSYWIESSNKRSTIHKFMVE